MKVFSVFGITLSGKTTTIENIIRELTKRRYSVGSVKEIHFEEFAIDQEGSNTDRHWRAGSQLVTARGYNETDILYKKMLTIEEILRFYSHDYVVLEGVTNSNVPKIIAAHTIEEIEERLDDSVFAISGQIAKELTEYKGLPVINSMDNIEALVNLIEEKVFEKLPEFPPECCSSCGSSCEELSAKILKGEAKREDCSIEKGAISLKINDNEIKMVPFVKSILLNTVLGVIKELEGYQEGAEITIRIGN